MEVREVRLAAGAGFVVVICGNIMTMPGLPKKPAAVNIDVDAEGKITGGCSDVAFPVPVSTVRCYTN